MGRPSVILVGQTPPPVHGQALAIQRLVQARFGRLVVHHVPMDFSSSMDEVGRVGLRKVWRLLRLIGRVLRVRIGVGPAILYYPPAGPALVPVLRDIAFLSVVRPFFQTVVFDYHAGGGEEMEDRLPPGLRGLFHHAYGDATLAIERYPRGPGASRIAARRRVVVPYGIEDEFCRFGRQASKRTGFTVLYVGLVADAKGVGTFLEAVWRLRQKGVGVRAVVVGEFASPREKQRLETAVRRWGIREHVRFLGKLVGEAKWQQFRDADVFCFPSHYENEAFPIVIIEAMQFGLPVVASDWRGIPHLVGDGDNGFLVPPRDSAAVADRLERLALRPDLRESMGARGRQLYLENYTVEGYLWAMEEALLSAAGEGESGGMTCCPDRGAAR